jgi:ubiquinone/menaquinone biosynthesis C-methylase UbiE
MARQRTAQLEYSELMGAMLDEEKRRQKARKIIAVLRHFLGRDDLGGLTVADIGCSAGFIADELAAAGAARTLGVDVDVPGLRKAHERFGERVAFCCGDGERLPFPDGGVDVLVFNHIYEHVLDPDAILAEMHRVLSDDGVLYLGLGNRLGVMEPHYKLPFLSYLPPALSDAYMRAAGRGDHYHERFRTRGGLRRMLAGWFVWDYSLPVLGDPGRFASADIAPGPVARLPRTAVRAALPVVPTYIWVATKRPRTPLGPHTAWPPLRVPTPAREAASRAPRGPAPP